MGGDRSDAHAAARRTRRDRHRRRIRHRRRDRRRACTPTARRSPCSTATPRARTPPSPRSRPTCPTARSVDAAVAAVAEQFGRIDIVVNNAGIGAQGDISRERRRRVGARALDQRHRHRPRHRGGAALAAEVAGARRSCNTASIASTDRPAAARAVQRVEGRGLGPHPRHGRRSPARGHPRQRRQPRHRRHPVGRTPARLRRRPGRRARRPRGPPAARPPGLARRGRRARSPTSSAPPPGRRPARSSRSTAAWRSCACARRQLTRRVRRVSGTLASAASPATRARATGARPAASPGCRGADAPRAHPPASAAGRSGRTRSALRHRIASTSCPRRSAQAITASAHRLRAVGWYIGDPSAGACGSPSSAGPIDRHRPVAPPHQPLRRRTHRRPRRGRASSCSGDPVAAGLARQTRQLARRRADAAARSSRSRTHSIVGAHRSIRGADRRLAEVVEHDPQLGHGAGEAGDLGQLRGAHARVEASTRGRRPRAHRSRTPSDTASPSGSPCRLCRTPTTSGVRGEPFEVRGRVGAAVEPRAGDDADARRRASASPATQRTSSRSVARPSRPARRRPPRSDVAGDPRAFDLGCTEAVGRAGPRARS